MLIFKMKHYNEKKNYILKTTSYTIQSYTDKKFIPRYFGNNIIVFITSFLGKIKLPIVNNKFVATNALIDAIIKYWFILNSTKENVSYQNRKIRLLNYNDETIYIYNYFGLTFLNTNRPEFVNVKKIFKKQIKRNYPIYIDSIHQNIIFSDLFNLTNLVSDKCKAAMNTVIITELDIKAINNLLNEFQKVLQSI